MFKPRSREPWSHDFRHVLSKELDHIGKPDCPAKNPDTPANEPAGPDARGSANADGCANDPIARAHEKQLIGLAFSGGGIRSATFNLGVLQALARMKLLGKFDYLSTVSGGGYIGSWLMAWIKQRGMKDVSASLRPERERQPGRTEPEEIHFLRRFSNYLTPKLGWLGADMWTVIAIYIRNLLLNMMILAGAFAFVLLFPRWIAFGSQFAGKTLWLPLLILVALAALFGAIIAILRSMRYFAMHSAAQRAGSEKIEEMEKRIGWRDANGEPVEVAELKAPAAWYSTELFDDFILRLDFEITAPSRANIYVWTPWNESEQRPALTEIGGGVVHVGCAGQECGATGSIDEQAPVREAAVKPGKNTLEITCVNERCTVRVNGDTINTARVERAKQPLRSLFSRTRPLPGAIGIENGGVHITDVAVEKIQTAWSTGATQGQVQRWIIAPLFLAAFLAATYLFGFGDYFPDQPGPVTLAGDTPMRLWMGFLSMQNPWNWWTASLVAGGACAAFVFVGRLILARTRKQSVAREAMHVLPGTIGVFFAAGLGGLMARYLYDLFRCETVWSIMVWGTPAVLGAFLLATVLLMGLFGRDLADERREWWSRLSAWLLIYALAWMAIFGLAFYAPPLVRFAIQSAPGWLSTISVAWVVSTLAGLIAAKSAASGPQNSNRLVEFLVKMAPYVFVIGFLVLLSWLLDSLVARNWTHLDAVVGKRSFGAMVWNQWSNMYNTDRLWLLKLTLGCGFLAALLSFRLDINQFSMHLLYRNRLGRCYLGASNRLRRAQPFTGFSADDDIPLCKLEELFPRGGPARAPYPIINAALNLVGGKELAWQQRKAASFVFTPLYCGYEFTELPPGFCETKKFAAVPSPVTLATAMAISGAAASPNMGYHTSPAPAFLMTVFNVRLGWWLGNPREQRGYERSGPLNVLASLIAELFGLTSEEGKYIYLSDGGHFENLGIYELVRRRCRFIVACDAEEDHLLGFGGLGNAIEKCRADFGIDIDIDVEPIRRRSEKQHSDWHCAIGKIRYNRVDRNAREGILVYLKSSLTGDEPTDVLRYAAANPGFPHQSTGDQWFDESQFESYRALGFHITRDVFGALGSVERISNLTTEQLFVELAQNWYPPSAATAEAFTKHTNALAEIYDELRTNKDLGFLNRDIYPEWRTLFGEEPPKSSSLAFERPEFSRKQLPESKEELRAGFYICTAICALFEAVYVDLCLEQEFDHPDNRGWMNFFRHWSAAPMFRVTWTISASNYGARFQSFCARHLNLKIGLAHPTTLELKDDGLNDPEIKWTPETGKIAEKIVEAIWTWLDGLPVGSEVVAQAALTVTEKAPYSKIPSGLRSRAEENKALEMAKSLIRDELEAIGKRGKSPKKPPLKKDEEWHAAATLLEFLRRGLAGETFKEVWPAKVSELALLHAANIAQRVLDKTFQKELNPMERELIEFFFIFNPGLAARAEIVRLEITPETREDVLPDPEQGLYFPFGFAVLAKIECPPQPDERPKLVYLRVQDHLRRMGLARKALECLVSDHPELEIDLKQMHPKAPEVPTQKDHMRLLRLYHSVKTEFRQKQDA